MEYASNGKANAGLALGIIGTSLAGILATNGFNGGNGGLFNWGNTSRAEQEQSKVSALEAKVAELQAMRYTDQVGIDLYKNIVEVSKEEDAKISANLREVMGYIVELSKDVALNKQAATYDNIITNNKIDCCCDKMNIVTCYENKLRDLADASIISYVNSTFLPGTLKLPITSICPQPATATTTTAA